MAAILGPGGPSTATYFATDGPEGPIFGGPILGDHLWHDRSTFYWHRSRYFINGKWISSAEKDGDDASDLDQTTDEHDAAAGDLSFSSTDRIVKTKRLIRWILIIQWIMTVDRLQTVKLIS